jgi:hypothetical protein
MQKRSNISEADAFLHQAVFPFTGPPHLSDSRTFQVFTA